MYDYMVNPAEDCVLGKSHNLGARIVKYKLVDGGHHAKLKGNGIDRMVPVRSLMFLEEGVYAKTDEPITSNNFHQYVLYLSAENFTFNNKFYSEWEGK